MNNFIEIFKRSVQQEPHKGVRHTRWVIFYATKPKGFFEKLLWAVRIFPGAVIYPRSNVGDLTIDLLWHDETRIKIDLIFLFEDKPRDVQSFISLEATGALVGAVVSDEIIGKIEYSCIGRFPPRYMGGATWSGLLRE